MNEYTRPEAANAALLTIDVQRDFTDPAGASPIRGTMDAVPAMTRLVTTFRNLGRPIVHAVRLYRRDGSNVDICRRASVEGGESLVAPDSAGAELVEELTPTEGTSVDAETLLAGRPQSIGESEWLLYKPRWSAFYGTPLDDLLAGFGVSTVVVCGCNFPNCPRATVYDASARDYRIVMVADATSRTTDRGLDELADIGVKVTTTADTVAWLQSG